MTHSDLIHDHAPFRGARTRSWNYPCSVTNIHVSSHCIHRQLSKCMSDADISEGFTNVYGSFTATMPAADWMRSSLKIKIPVQGKQQHAGIHWDNDTPPDSPLSFSQIDSCGSPSISRTSLPPDPAWDESPRKPPAEIHKLHPVLEGLERKSRVSCSSQCSTCLKSGRDFPRCGRCGQMWCSRDCRLQGGKSTSVPRVGTSALSAYLGKKISVPPNASGCSHILSLYCSALPRICVDYTACIYRPEQSVVSVLYGYSQR
ncbi:hypothetical protein BKA83DRAFT_2082597 [Pisolithus microcarpus]|nr:hypothetical protein BKA83DRAFT_2082597 [Pisolithus microcarpus]